MGPHWLTAGIKHGHVLIVSMHEEAAAVRANRALAEGLTAQQSDAEFNRALDASVESIYRASIT